MGSYRFDDPAGEVGLEAHLVETESGLLHVPMTYRAEPLEGAEDHLIGTMEHGVLGQRWAYDGEFDPVWRAAALEAIFTGGHEASLDVQIDGEIVETREPTMTVRGTGSGDVPTNASLHIVRRVGEPINGDHQLLGTWATGSGVLAAARSL